MEDLKKTILIIDDDLEYTRLIKVWLANSEFNLEVCNSSAKTFEIFEQCKPDLILLDINMPNINGHELCAILKTHNDSKNVPVLFLSANADEDSQEKALAVGAQGFLSKLVQKDGFLKTLKTTL